MENQKSNLTEEELRLIEETERFMEEVNRDPDVANAPLPPNLRENVYREIRAREAERAIRAIDEELAKVEASAGEVCVEEETDTKEAVSAEDKELIRLGKIYKKRRKVQKYLILAAALVFVLAFGITSMGGPKKLFEKVNWMLGDREQINVDSDDDSVVQIDNVKEEEVYQEIEDRFGFLPVKLLYRPEGVFLLEANIGEEIQGVHLIYGASQQANISYHIRPNYRESSWGKDIEDELLKEEKMTVSGVEIYLKQYRVDEETERWLVGFEYKNVSYSMLIMDLDESEIEKIVKNLTFF